MDAQFVKLLMEHRSLLHSFIYALVRDVHLAEDILQEMGVVLWTKFGEFRSGSNFGAWAREIADGGSRSGPKGSIRRLPQGSRPSTRIRSISR